MGEEGEKGGEKIVSGRIWWVVFVNGNRVMERGVYDGKFEDANWEKERRFDGRNEQDSKLVVGWLGEEVRRDISEMVRTGAGGASNLLEE